MGKPPALENRFPPQILPFESETVGPLIAFPLGLDKQLDYLGFGRTAGGNK
jgi:hypothetical protein